MLSKRALSLSPSPTLAVDAKVKELQASGISIVNLSLGEPDFDTPKHIQNAATSAMKEGFTHYTAVAGIPELRTAVAAKFKNDNGINYAADEIIIGMGSKTLLYLAFQTLVNPGDEVIIPIPTWNTFVEQVKLAKGKPVFINLKPPFKLTAAEIEKKITKKTKVILLNSPANPTGAMIEKKELKTIAELVLQYKLFVISDEIYEKLIYANRHYSIASFSKAIKERVMTINGFSKSYAMTGWRIGYAGGPKEIIAAMTALQSQLTSNAVSFVQKAGVTALQEEQTSVAAMHSEFAKRRSFITSALDTIPALSYTAPEGAFYVFVSVQGLLVKQYKTSAAWCSGLLEHQRVAVVPGEAFFAPGYFRLSYAASLKDLQKAVEGIQVFMQKNSL